MIIEFVNVRSNDTISSQVSQKKQIKNEKLDYIQMTEILEAYEEEKLRNDLVVMEMSSLVASRINASTRIKRFSLFFFPTYSVHN